MKHIGLFAAGVLPPAASVLRHNLSTLSISLRRTSDLPPEAEQEVRALPSTSSALSIFRTMRKLSVMVWSGKVCSIWWNPVRSVWESPLVLRTSISPCVPNTYSK